MSWTVFVMIQKHYAYMQMRERNVMPISFVFVSCRLVNWHTNLLWLSSDATFAVIKLKLFACKKKRNFFLAAVILHDCRRDFWRTVLIWRVYVLKDGPICYADRNNLFCKFTLTLKFSLFSVQILFMNSNVKILHNLCISDSDYHSSVVGRLIQ